MPQIKEKYAEKLEWHYRNTDEDPEAIKTLMSLSSHFNREKAKYPSIFVGSFFMVGTDEISEDLEKAIEITLKKKNKPIKLREIELEEVFGKLSAIAVMSSGLIDGVNPCAFAVIVFFVSFLSVYGYKKKHIICVGSFYCLAVFLAYLLIGLGFFRFLYSFIGFYYLIKTFYYFVAVACFSLAALSVYDYIKFKRSGIGSGMVLRLPDIFKKKINRIIGSRLRGKKERGLIDLSITSFVIGFLVSLLEAVCTGQVYLPTIVFILKNTELRVKAFSYLILYNLMFILPLIAIFLLSILGVSSQKFNDFLKNHLGRIKILMAVLFFILGALIIWLS
ncbi:MAG: hypothetical protein ABIH71_00590 [Candidatus Omnitrophota bacterium]